MKQTDASICNSSKVLSARWQLTRGHLTIQCHHMLKSTHILHSNIAHLTMCYLLCSHRKQHKVENSHKRNCAKDGEKSS